MLRRLERFDLEVLHLAIKDAQQMRAASFDAIKHLLLCRVERRPHRLDLDVHRSTVSRLMQEGLVNAAT